MRLLLVHGRSQGKRTEEDLLDEWTSAIAKGLVECSLPPLTDDIQIKLPFYGRRLDELTADKPSAGEVTQRGTQPPATDIRERALVLEIAGRAGITDEEIAAEAAVEVGERGPENLEWVQAAARLLDRNVPWLGDKLLSVFTADVYAYLKRPHVTKVVDDIVGADLGDGPTVVVGHSLGSIVAYNILRKAGTRVRVPLFLTVGSPLGIDAVKEMMTGPLGMPAGVERWVNASDERDFVALNARLDRDTFPADIENFSDVHNPRDNPHGIVGYLSDRLVLTKISQALAI